MKKRQTAFWLLILASLLLLLAAGPGLASAQTPETGADGDAAVPTESDVLDEVVITRTPSPTATPGVITERVEDLAYQAGLARTEFLGLSVSDWINLAISALTVVAGYAIGTLLIRRILPRVVARSESAFDDEFLQAIGGDVRWLVVVFTLYFATTRLTFAAAWLKSFLEDAYFVAGLIIVTRIVLRLVDLADTWAFRRADEQGRGDELAPVITLLARVGKVAIILSAGIILLSNFGVNVTAFAALLGLGGLALSLAAQDTIADAISGFIILVDQPFRIGDRIEIQDEGTWGDVVEIGLRTTRIRTRDNRMVIVPNSVIGKNQVVNYTFPDPRYRIQTHVTIAYGTDIEEARRVIIDIVRQVEGILPDKPVDALYIEMGDWAMVFRVRWWIESYEDTRRVMDRVHTALQRGLDKAGIESPFPSQDLNLHLDESSGGYFPSREKPDFEVPSEE